MVPSPPGHHGVSMATMWNLLSEPRNHRSTQSTNSAVCDPNRLIALLLFLYHHVNLDILLAVDMHLVFILGNVQRVYMHHISIYRSPQFHTIVDLRHTSDIVNIDPASEPGGKYYSHTFLNRCNVHPKMVGRRSWQSDL